MSHFGLETLQLILVKLNVTLPIIYKRSSEKLNLEIMICQLNSLDKISSRKTGKTSLQVGIVKDCHIRRLHFVANPSRSITIQHIPHVSGRFSFHCRVWNWDPSLTAPSQWSILPGQIDGKQSTDDALLLGAAGQRRSSCTPGPTSWATALR